jgi:hypothetical protein
VVGELGEILLGTATASPSHKADFGKCGKINAQISLRETLVDARRRLFSLTRLLFSYLSLTRALFSSLRIHLHILGSLSLGNYRSRAP